MQEIRLASFFTPRGIIFKHFGNCLRLVDYERGSGSIIRLNGEIDESVFVYAWVRAVVAASYGFYQRDVSWIALSCGVARTGNARPTFAIHATAASAAGNKNRLGISARQGSGA
jgi:hypothetical protein